MPNASCTTETIRPTPRRSGANSTLTLTHTRRLFLYHHHSATNKGHTTINQLLRNREEAAIVFVVGNNVTNKQRCAQK
jgi:hypothetical protein